MRLQNVVAEYCWELPIRIVKNLAYLKMKKQIAAKQYLGAGINLKYVCHVEDHGADPSPLGQQVEHLCSVHYYIYIIRYLLDIYVFIMISIVYQQV